MKKKSTSKAKRNRLDSMVASGNSPAERKKILALQRNKPLTSIQNLVNTWQVVRWYRDNPETEAAKLDTFRAQRRSHAEKIAFEFIRDALDKNNFNAVRELALEMKRPTSPDLQPLEMRRWRLLPLVEKLLSGEIKKGEGQITTELENIAWQTVDDINPSNGELKNQIRREKLFDTIFRDLQKIKARWMTTIKQNNKA